jgi:hypothetical protein
MDAARASVEVQIVMAVGAFFVLMVFIAAIDWWYATSSDNPKRPLR